MSKVQGSRIVTHGSWTLYHRSKQKATILLQHPLFLNNLLAITLPLRDQPLTSLDVQALVLGLLDQSRHLGRSRITISHKRLKISNSGLQQLLQLLIGLLFHLCELRVVLEHVHVWGAPRYIVRCIRLWSIGCGLSTSM